MSEDRTKRLALARRRNQGSKILPNWGKSIGEASGVAVSHDDFLGIEETEALKNAFFGKVKNRKDAFHRTWPSSSWPENSAILAALAGSCDLSIILFSDVDQFIGALRVPAAAVLANSEKVWEVVGEDLCMTTQNLADGLCMERDSWDETGEYAREGVYEITAWGALVPELREP